MHRVHYTRDYGLGTRRVVRCILHAHGKSPRQIIGKRAFQKRQPTTREWIGAVPPMLSASLTRPAALLRALRCGTTPRGLAS
jgi:hypothetical protein